MSRNKYHSPKGAAAEGGRPIGGAAEGGASVFFVSAHLFLILCIFTDIPYIFLIYFIFICPKYVPSFFLYMFLNLWSQQKTSPYRKTTFILFFSRIYAF